MTNDRARSNFLLGFLPAGLVAMLVGLAVLSVFRFSSGAQQGPGGLVVGSRTELRACVDGAGGYNATVMDVDATSQAIGAALETLATPPPEFGTPSVEKGCPALIPVTGRRLDSSELCCVYHKVLKDAAAADPRRLFVYFVPDAAYGASFGDRPYAVASAELLCRGDTCEVTTTALYVPVSVQGDILQAAILRGLGLSSDLMVPEPTIDWQACMQGTPRPWCKTLEFCKQLPDDYDCAQLLKDLGLPP